MGIFWSVMTICLLSSPFLSSNFLTRVCQSWLWWAVWKLSFCSQGIQQIWQKGIGRFRKAIPRKRIWLVRRGWKGKLSRDRKSFGGEMRWCSTQTHKLSLQTSASPEYKNKTGVHKGTSVKWEWVGQEFWKRKNCFFQNILDGRRASSSGVPKPSRMEDHWALIIASHWTFASHPFPPTWWQAQHPQWQPLQNHLKEKSEEQEKLILLGLIQRVGWVFCNFLL